MPTYEYACSECTNVIELHSGIKERIALPVCKNDGSKMHKIISMTSAPIFKGAGFHCNDYKGK